MPSPASPESEALNRTVKVVALLNLDYFGIEFTVAQTIGSVSLFADSVDFLKDAAVNGLILVALVWSAHRRSIVGMVLAAILLAPPSQLLGRPGRSSTRRFRRQRCPSL